MPRACIACICANRYSFEGCSMTRVAIRHVLLRLAVCRQQIKVGLRRYKEYLLHVLHVLDLANVLYLLGCELLGREASRHHKARLLAAHACKQSNRVDLTRQLQYLADSSLATGRAP